MNFDESVRYLFGLGHETLAIKLGLDQITRLLSRLNNPQNSFASAQIAGTNGKGSTAALLDSICRQASINTGLYTSPHLVSVTERIRINGDEIAQADFARIANSVRREAEELERESGALPTFFEQLTAISLVAFREGNVRLAILETGLGGRLDATTAAQAQTIALTPISIDHIEYLGDTLEAIAAEKAAIIRACTSVVSAPQALQAHEVIEQRCRSEKVTPRFVGKQIEVAGVCADGRLRVNFKTEEDVYENVCLGLRGRHQMINAAVAIEVAEVLRERGFQISRENIIAGLDAARHDGRLEFVRNASHTYLFDGAHNAAGATALEEYINEFVTAPVTLLFGAMRDKDLSEISNRLFPLARRLVLTAINNPRAATLDTLSGYLPRDYDPAKIVCASNSAEALRAAQEITLPGEVICVTGSLYLVGEIKSLLARQGQQNTEART